MVNIGLMKAVLDEYENKGRIAKGRLGDKYDHGEENTEEWNTLVHAETAFLDANRDVGNFDGIASIMNYGWDSDSGYEITALAEYAADWDKIDGTNFGPMMNDAIASLKSAFQAFNSAYDKYATAVSIISEKMENSL